jgi:Chlorophyll A-B binding protein
VFLNLELLVQPKLTQHSKESCGMISSRHTRIFKKSMSEKKAPAAETPKNPTDPAFGWTSYAEQVNGRFAMVGFVVLLAIELFTKQDIITWLGLR